MATAGYVGPGDGGDAVAVEHSQRCRLFHRPRLALKFRHRDRPEVECLFGPGLALQRLLAHPTGMETVRSPRILVVDDEPPLVELVRGYLAREGFEILTAGDGPSAVQMVRDETPDVVVLDV